MAVYIEKTTVTETWYEVYNREIELQRVSALEDSVSVKLLNNEDGGGIDLPPFKRVQNV